MANVDPSKTLGGLEPIILGNYAVADLPSASSDLKGALAVVTDSGHANGSAQLALCDGSNWVCAFGTAATLST